MTLLTIILRFRYCFSTFFPYFCYRNMLQLPRLIKRHLSLRISLMVVFAMAILLMASLIVMLHYSRKAVKEETIHRAMETLEGTVTRIDNILLSVEQSIGNIFYAMLPYLDQPEKMYEFSRMLVETNHYVGGCAIAFKEDYFKDRKLFMAYMHRGESNGVAYANSRIERDEMFGNTPYTEQVWYTKPMETGLATWLNPLKGMEDSDEAPIMTFSLPIPGKDGKPIGVIGVDVSLRVLSTIMTEAKLSPNSYSTLLDSEGTYIVHPNANKLMRQTTAALAGKDIDPSAREAARAMVAGEEGYRPFRNDGVDYYVFFKPFRRKAIPGRSADDLGWSAGIIYPEDDIFGEYNSLMYYVLVIAAVGLLLIFVLSRLFIHRQLMTLNMLTGEAQRIAGGQYNVPIPSSKRRDEVGRLQDNFRHMQLTLSTNIGEMEQLKVKLQQHGEELKTAYKRAQKADRMKTSFLHNMTNQMLAPSEAIDQDVEALSSGSVDRQELVQRVENIVQNGETIAELLRNLINVSDEDEVKYDRSS